jgi:hypothetical protein
MLTQKATRALSFLLEVREIMEFIAAGVLGAGTTRVFPQKMRAILWLAVRIVLASARKHRDGVFIRFDSL